MVTEHAICALPEHHRDWHLFVIRVQWQRADRGLIDMVERMGEDDLLVVAS